MKIITPNWDTLTEAQVQINNYSGDPDSFVIYDKNDDNGVYFPSFIRYGDSVIDPGVKLTIEVVENGYLIRSGKKSYIIGDDSWSLRDKIETITHKIIEKERDLAEDEIEELTTMTLEMNTHFAAQSKR